MKLYKKLVFILSLLCTFAFGPNVWASAVEPNYVIESVYINSSVDFLGSMHITEAIVVKGSINGFERVISYKNDVTDEWEAGKINFEESSFYNGRGYSISKITSFAIDKEDIGWNLISQSHTVYEEVESASKGDTGVYTSNENDSGTAIRIYNPNESGYVVYFIDYYINQAVVLHNDVAELNWNFLPADFDYVKNLNIQVTLPGKCTNETFRFWGHGALNGNIAGISESKDDDGNDLYQGVLVTASDVQSGSGFNVRITFDKSLVSFASNFLNNSEQDALDEIIAIETRRANSANAQRLYIKIIYYGTFVLAGLYFIGLVILWIYTYQKYDKEYKVNFDAKYYREFTGDYSVEVVDYLMKKDISTDAFSASIMNLVYKKNIEVESIPDSKKDSKLKLVSRENVSESEDALISLLFDEIGKNSEVTLKQIEKFSKKESTAKKFMNKYDAWKNIVISDGKKEEFFEDKSAPKLIGGAYFALGMLLCFLIFVFNSNAVLVAMVTLAFSIIFLVYTCSFKKWSKKGREHYLKWSAFKNFLNDFGNFADKEVPEIKLWEKYLVYATVFGIAKKVQDVMKVRLTEIGDETYVSNYTTFYNNIYIGNYISSAVSHAYSGSVATINAANASSSMSSGGGFGGGTTSGGGFSGGGGGSGHGF